MKLITVTDETTGVAVQRVVSTEELETLSGVQLAALLFPDPSEDNITEINQFLSHYRGGCR